MRCRDYGRLVIDDEPEVAARIRTLRPWFGERNELVAQVDERHPVHPAAQLQLEQAPVEGERFVDRIDLEREMIDPNRTSHGTDITHRV